LGGTDENMFNIGEDFQEAVLSRDLRETGEQSRSGQDREGEREGGEGGGGGRETGRRAKTQSSKRLSSRVER
jgi:hypothetical protein